MITGRFEVVGIRKFKELPKGALFVENILCVWKDYWVGEGLLVYGAENGRETPLLRKVKHGKYGQDSVVERLDGGEEEEGRFWVGPREWVTWLKKAEGERRTWAKRKVLVHVTTFGQLHEGEAFVRVGDCAESLEGFNSRSPSTPRVYRRKGELGIRLDGDGEREIAPLERVIPVAVGDIRAPEYVLIRIRKDGPYGRLYPEKRSRAEHPEHYEIVEEGFPDRISATERARKLWSERPTE